MTRRAPARVDWVDRQPAAGNDFRAILGFLDARRARHLRGAHHTWGVALGLGVTADFRTSPRTVTIEPGLAYDASGCELLVDRAVTVPIPRELTTLATVVIFSSGRVPHVWAGVVEGHRPERLGLEVPVAHLDLDVGWLDMTTRPHVQRMAPPHVAGGLVAVGAAPATGTTYEHTVQVDTRAARFTAAALYLVTPVLPLESPTGFAGLLGPLVEVHDARAAGFTATVRFLAPTAAASTAAASSSRVVHANPLALSWTGFEGAPLAPVATDTTIPPATI